MGECIKEPFKNVSRLRARSHHRLTTQEHKSNMETKYMDAYYAISHNQEIQECEA